jgi:hypothetical protein
VSFFPQIYASLLHLFFPKKSLWPIGTGFLCFAKKINYIPDVDNNFFIFLKNILSLDVGYVKDFSSVLLS